VAKKRTGGKKGGSRKRKTAVRKRKPQKIELRSVRKALRAHAQKLGTAIKTSEKPKPKLKATLKRVNRMLAEVGRICGPNMSVNLA